MSGSRPILMPSDYKVVRPWVPRGEAVFPEFMKIIGANGVEAGITEVFADLQTGTVDTVMVSAIAAVALQWFTKMHHVAKEAQVPIVGATLLRKDFFDGLEGVSPERKKELAAKVAETGKKAHAILLKKIEEEDKAAYKAILSKGTIKEFSMAEKPEQKKAWTDASIELRKRLTGKLWDRAFYEKTMKAAGKAPEFK
jgi:TRAP-type C4-dicarboxylate transport system substrate-binding protein